MAHARKRIILDKAKKHLKFFKIVAIQGARQTGKSFLAREWISPAYPKSKYLTLDDESVKSVANQSAKTFLTEHENFAPLIIDEAQKAPPLFDALKFKVDQSSRPGQYLILGSTEFSRQVLIRESLTGRLGRVRLFPMNLQEISDSTDYALKDLLKYLTHGGLPGICFVREEENWNAFLQDWIDLTCGRDLQQFKKKKLDGDLALQILRRAATLTEPTNAELSKVLNVNYKSIQSHLDALVELFVLTKINPHPRGTGKVIYLPFDSGVAHFLGANRERCLHIWLLNELMSRDAYLNKKRSTFYYYRSTGKKWIHIIEESADRKTQAWQLILHENIKKPDSELMKAFLKKVERAKGVIAGPVSEKIKLNEIDYVPWQNSVRYSVGFK